MIENAYSVAFFHENQNNLRSSQSVHIIVKKTICHMTCHLNKENVYLEK